MTRESDFIGESCFLPKNFENLLPTQVKYFFRICCQPSWIAAITRNNKNGCHGFNIKDGNLGQSSTSTCWQPSWMAPITRNKEEKQSSLTQHEYSSKSLSSFLEFDYFVHRTMIWNRCTIFRPPPPSQLALPDHVTGLSQSIPCKLMIQDFLGYFLWYFNESRKKSRNITCLNRIGPFHNVTPVCDRLINWIDAQCTQFRL